MYTEDVENINGTNQGRDSLIRYGLFPQEHKGWRKGTRVIGESLYSDQHILKESKTRCKNSAVSWIYYKKAYNMVPRSWIIDCLKIYKTSDEVIKFSGETINNWRVDFKAGGKSLAEVKIQSGMFQGNALWLLQFVIATMLLNQILRKCTGGYKLHKS